MDENPKTIPTGFAPLDFIVTLVMPSISEPIIERWDNVVFPSSRTNPFVWRYAGQSLIFYIDGLIY